MIKKKKINDSSEAHAEVYNSGIKATLLVDEKGQPVLGPDKAPSRGIVVGEFLIDPKCSGGDYTLPLKEASNRFQTQVRKFRVSRYEPRRLNKELYFGFFFFKQKTAYEITV